MNGVIFKSEEKMTYKEIYHYLHNVSSFGSIYGLERINKLLELLNHPEENLNIIHTAGTNGKGSTNAFISSVLREQGYTVFSYISPSLDQYLDRFLINGQPIKKNIFELVMPKVIEIAKNIKQTSLGHPTIFEMEVACSYLLAQYFNADFMIQETGLGGRLDATNAISSPLITVITSISKDHLNILGDTLEKIAKEKAGIIKYQRPVILYDNGELNTIFIDKAKELEAPLQIVNFSNIQDTSNLTVTSFSYCNQNYNLGLHGTHQVKNGFVALMTLFQLRKEGYSIDDNAILKGFKSVIWKGRFEKIMDNPIVYLDGAHNEDSISILLNNLNNRHKEAYHIFIVHIYADKDVSSILKQLSSFPNEIICTSIYNERSLSAKNLYSLAKKFIPINKIFLELSLRGAIALSLQHAAIHKNTVITILGSLSHLEKSRNIIMEEK